MPLCFAKCYLQPKINGRVLVPKLKFQNIRKIDTIVSVYKLGGNQFTLTCSLLVAMNCIFFAFRQ